MFIATNVVKSLEPPFLTNKNKNQCDVVVMVLVVTLLVLMCSLDFIYSEAIVEIWIRFV